MSVKNRLQKNIYSVLKHNRDGSYETQAARKHILYQAASELVDGSYKLNSVHGLKQKHIYYLYHTWQARKLSVATIKNRLAHLRWLCEKLNKMHTVPSNQILNVGKRCYVNNQINKAIDLTQIKTEKITNRYVQVQIHLQRYFGLRREESIKLKPYQADKGDYIELQGSWCKNGRKRYVPVLSLEARYWLDEAKKLVANPGDSLIPQDKTYIEHRERYDKQIQRAGIKHAHGLRHAFAQEQYKILTSWECPKRGGPTTKQLTPEQKQQDRIARTKISEWLGHSRSQIVANYCG